MRPRQILGLIMVFVFLPLNSGLYLSLLGGEDATGRVPGNIACYMILLFILGAVLLLTPTRQQKYVAYHESE
ncbi:MAG TPA: hypothetical protein HA345_01440 [Candidatus Thalassarchaeaceae archaeon]|jgi:hypothetical protein|nr:MAG TPA: hypothetical protein D7H94_01425 [Candidatus Poseidoniales archaeon]DAC24933.1 MAG TPA: hypothetical protein D7H85_05695 [Candidatus Poseidoniales archaeon]HIH84051.1 hypothetical protein [Candidatus Thalassarchaeaceae archaeon]HII49365.1 hypothetical protein [Candidatus Thalassarchaeaceae archaeon]